MSKEKREILRTPAGVAKYPRLGSPDTKYKAEGEYKITLVLDRSEDGVEEFIESIEAAEAESVKAALAKGKGKKPKKADSPIKPHIDDDGNEVEGKVEVSFKMKASGTREDGTEWSQRPAVVDAKKRPTDAKVGAGSTVKVAYELSPYFTPALGAGVSLRLKAVQVIDLVEYSGGGNSAAAFDEEDGYETTEESVEDSDGAEEEESVEDTGEEPEEQSEEGEEEEEAPAPKKEPAKASAKQSSKPAAKPSAKPAATTKGKKPSHHGDF